MISDYVDTLLSTPNGIARARRSLHTLTMNRSSFILFALLLPGCCCLHRCPSGNTKDQHFEVRARTGAELALGDDFSSRSLRLARGGTMTLDIREVSYGLLPQTSPPLSSVTSEAPGIVEVLRSDRDSVTIRGIAAGETYLEIVAGDDDATTDKFKVIVHELQSMRLADACMESSPYWAGMPAFVRYELYDYVDPDTTALGTTRVWGADALQLEQNPNLRPDFAGANDFEIRIVGPTEPVETTLISSLEGDSEELSMAFREPPRISGVRYIHLPTAQRLSTPFVHPDSRSLFRAYPVAESGEEMCNTTVGVKVRSKSEDACLVRAYRAGKKFDSVATVDDGLFELMGLEHGECLLEITVIVGAAWLLAEGIEELVFEQAVDFYTVGSRTGGGSSSSDHDYDYDYDYD